MFHIFIHIYLLFVLVLKIKLIFVKFVVLSKVKYTKYILPFKTGI